MMIVGQMVTLLVWRFVSGIGLVCDLLNATTAHNDCRANAYNFGRFASGIGFISAVLFFNTIKVSDSRLSTNLITIYQRVNQNYFIIY